MIRGKSLLVVVPAYNEEQQIPRVLSTLPSIVDHVVIIDDGSTDGTREVALRAHEWTSTPVTVLSHEASQGVGAAIATGYQFGVDEEFDLFAVMAGDGQMPPEDLPALATPVALGECDYAKANRLAKLSWWRRIPPKRLAGNLALSVLTQLATGYWGTWDSQTGYTVISRRAAAHILQWGIYPSYGCPNDILMKLSAGGYRVRNVPSAPVYNVGEKSKLRIRRVIGRIPLLLARGFAWRMRQRFVGQQQSFVRGILTLRARWLQ